ncbi:MAG: hypothetical protein FJZ86_04205 [Chloroflexi bacterium]|nr:hypothetical protein [Chloroflexota bacterium]
MKYPTGKQKHSFTINFFEQHLAQALDDLWRVGGIEEDYSHDNFLIRWRLSISCILHSFYALDSLVNFLAYEYFENSKSNWYIEIEDREFFTEKHLKDWQKLSFEKRINIVWKEQGFASIPQEINNKITELKNLRNWVAHGNPYTIIVEHEFIRVDDETVRGITHATYPDPNQKGFQSEEYKSPAYLTKDDAQKAVRHALECIVFILNQAKGFHVILKTFYGGKKEYWFDGNKPVDEVLRDLSIDA